MQYIILNCSINDINSISSFHTRDFIKRIAIRDRTGGYFSRGHPWERETAGPGINERDSHGNGDIGKLIFIYNNFFLN